ncbi:MAG: MFS transporter [Firmicutes bacterium HGW-Firmicutes-16]|nr:MAG: MFS transporter [Firmicutes bacterium HGW-Firmicutes-16]
MDNWKKKTALFLASQAITLLGSSLVQYSIIWYVANETKSGVMVTLMTICGFLPQVLISIFAGVWADRFSRKKMIIMADGCIAVSTLILAFIVMNTKDFFWALLVISAIRSVGAGIQTPAVNSAIPQLVPIDKLMRIGAINSSVQSIINIVAPIVGSGVLILGKFHYVMFIDVITAAIGISIFAFFVPLPKLERADGKELPGYFDDLKDGVSYALGHQFLRRTLIVCGVFCFLIVPAAILNELYVVRLFGDVFPDNSYLALAINAVAFFAGAIVGGIVLSAWGGFPNRLKTLALGGIGFGVTTIVIGLVSSFWLYLVVIFLAGFAMPFNNSPLMVMLQEKVEPEKQGRVFSLLQIVNVLVMQLGLLVFGPLADIVPLQWLMVGSGVGLLIMTVCIVRWKSFYREGVTLIAPLSDENEIP